MVVGSTRILQPANLHVCTPIVRVHVLKQPHDLVDAHSTLLVYMVKQDLKQDESTQDELLSKAC